jgi:hypothetical protein
MEKFWQKPYGKKLLRIRTIATRLIPVVESLAIWSHNEWLAMPMGLRNSLAIHQRRMTAALQELLSKFCHIYLDDIVIWSNNIIKHTKHIGMVMAALQKAR